MMIQVLAMNVFQQMVLDDCAQVQIAMSVLRTIHWRYRDDDSPVAYGHALLLSA